tara:strand:+ start:1037 stop:1783 length:747 start_codon:yes stop_codon:yes gene_type:complete
MQEKLIFKKKKNLIFAIFQKLFLFFLRIFVGKNYDYIKKKIKNVLETIKKIVLKTFYFSFLKLKYPKYYKLPFGHLNSLDKLLKFINILSKKNIKIFLIGGTLLGAIRQQSFAGRPSDIDLGIKEEDEKKLKQSFIELTENGASQIKDIKENGICKIQIVFNSILLDLHIFKKIKIKKKIYWVGDSKLNKVILFSKEELLKFKKGKLYNSSFLIPINSKKYLRSKYGLHWKQPSKRQFSWKVNSFING